MLLMFKGTRGVTHTSSPQHQRVMVKQFQKLANSFTLLQTLALDPNMPHLLWRSTNYDYPLATKLISVMDRPQTRKTSQHLPIIRPH
jgi:hypothetical protein